MQAVEIGHENKFARGIPHEIEFRENWFQQKQLLQCYKIWKSIHRSYPTSYDNHRQFETAQLMLFITAKIEVA